LNQGHGWADNAVQGCVVNELAHLFSGFELLAVEAVEQQGQEQVEHHEVADYQGRKEDS